MDPLILPVEWLLGVAFFAGVITVRNEMQYKFINKEMKSLCDWVHRHDPDHKV